MKAGDFNSAALERVKPPRDGPLQVYLDSNDYSVLSDLTKPSNSYAQPILQHLHKLCADGLIELRFSVVHVVEITHLDANARPMAIRRARCIRELTQGKCFRFWRELPPIEGACMVRGTPLFSRVVSDRGEWHPDLSELARLLRKMLVDGLESAFREQALNRKARRKIGRVLLPNGRLSPIALQLLKHGREDLLAKLAAEFPLSERFFREDLMLKFAKGDISEQALTEEFAIVFRDVERFVAWTFDRYDPDKELIKWLREFGRDQIEKIEKIRLDLATVQHRCGQTSMEINRRIADLDVQANIMKARRKLLEGIWDDQQAMLRNLGVSQLDWERLLSSELGTVPSLDAFAIALKQHMKRSVRISTVPRKLKTSDAGDLFHLIHVPYCDVFRADGDTAESAKPLGKAFNTRIVGKLRELTGVIDSELRMREKLT